MSLSAAQIEGREKGIGGTDSAVVLQVDPRKTPRQLYHEKRGEIPRDNLDDLEIVQWGHKLEDIIAREAAHRRGYEVRSENRIRHLSGSPLLGNIDRLVLNQRGGMEVKFVPYDAREWGSEADAMPDRVIVQVQQYLLITEREWWDVAALVRGRLQLYRLEADPEFHELVESAGNEFWARVKEGSPPEFDFGHRSTGDLLKKLYPGTSGERIELEQEMQHVHETLQRAAKQKAEAEKVERWCRNEIRAAMGEAAQGLLPEGGGYSRKIVPEAEIAATTRKEYSTLNYSARLRAKT